MSWLSSTRDWLYQLSLRYLPRRLPYPFACSHCSSRSRCDTGTHCGRPADCYPGTYSHTYTCTHCDTRATPHVTPHLLLLHCLLPRRHLHLLPRPTPTPTPIPGLKRIAFYSSDKIYTVDIDGTGLAKLTSSNRVKRYPDWSPSGNKLVYSRDGNIYVID